MCRLHICLTVKSGVSLMPWALRFKKRVKGYAAQALVTNGTERRESSPQRQRACTFFWGFLRWLAGFWRFWRVLARFVEISPGVLWVWGRSLAYPFALGLLKGCLGGGSLRQAQPERERERDARPRLARSIGASWPCCAALPSGGLIPAAAPETKSHRECWVRQAEASSAGQCPHRIRRWAACRIQVRE